MGDIMVSNETLAKFVRKTRDGRTLRFEIAILQQPQRARACGAGAKSSADRRPVDPPPVVELRIFDGDHDVTFQHNANFFLYTTLEAARHIATPKGGAIPPQQPVLTGTAVAGMAYLDRPCHAGYFIFPDLSVRHEGLYRLSFNLFEEVKMDADMDAENSLMKNHPNAKLLSRSPTDPHQFVHFRVEVKSEPFTVYSAKKFPGLTESTELSRCVAEQGCRVRIRRDVRIRVRKDTKHSNDDFNRESSEPRNERYPTPGPSDQLAVDRARSTTNNMNNGTSQPYPAIEAKSTNQEQQYIKQSPYSQHTAIAPQPSTHYPSHQSYRNPSQTYQTPAIPSHKVHSYHQQHQHHSRQNSSSSGQDIHRQSSQYSMSSYHHSAQPTRENSAYTIAVDSKYQPQSYHTSATPRSATPTNGSMLPLLSSLQPIVAASPTSYDQPSTFSSTSTNNKRGYSSVFNGVSNAGAVQYGARPEISGQELPLVETDDYGVVTEEQLAGLKDMLEYRRADGTRRVMRIPKQTF